MDAAPETLLPNGVIERLLAEALSHGGDFAEIYLERTRVNSISLEEQKIRSASYPTIRIAEITVSGS